MNGDSFNRSLKRTHDEISEISEDEAHMNGLNNNDAKRMKCEESRVVHLHSLKQGTNERDLEFIGTNQGGTVTNVRSFENGTQGFIEFDSLAASKKLLDYAQSHNIKAQYSNHKALKINNNINNNNNNNSFSSLSGYPFMSSIPDSALMRSEGFLSMNDSALTQSLDNTAVIRVVMHNLPANCLVPDFFYQSDLGKIGKILRVIAFTKAGINQALIEYSEKKSAFAAVDHFRKMPYLHGGAYTCRVEFSKMSSLTIKDSNQSKDYSLHPDAGSPILSSNIGQQFMSPTVLDAATLRMLQYIPYPHFQTAGLQLAGMPLASHLLSQAAASPYQLINKQESVLLVSNLNEEVITPEALFTLFGVYGDVQRVKILYKKKDSALIQMTDRQMCTHAITNLDRVRMFGKEVKVTMSKHSSVQMPKDGQPDAGLTKDFTNSPLHRFKKPGSKNFANIYPPSATLHLSNIPQSVTEEFLLEAFKDNDLIAEKFKFFPKDKKMALIELRNLEDGVSGLIRMHNFKLSDTSHLRVSFSKSSI